MPSDPPFITAAKVGFVIVWLALSALAGIALGLVGR